MAQVQHIPYRRSQVHVIIIVMDIHHGDRESGFVATEFTHLKSELHTTWLQRKAARRRFEVEYFLKWFGHEYVMPQLRKHLNPVGWASLLFEARASDGQNECERAHLCHFAS